MDLQSLKDDARGERRVKVVYNRLEDALWDQVEERESGCWEFTGTQHDSGYGQVSWRGQQHYAHRLSYRLTKGDPSGMYVCHACDNPPCVRPDHLWLGTFAENMEDKCAKGRSKGGTSRGEDHHKARLTEDQVRQIRTLRDAEGLSYSRLAARFDCTPTNIEFIVKRQTWSHVA